MGPVSFTMLLQPMSDNNRIPLPGYQIVAHPVGKPEKTVKGQPGVAPALNKPFRAEPLELTEPGLWLFDVQMDLQGRGVGDPLEARLEWRVENGYARRTPCGRCIGLRVAAPVISAAHRRLTARRRPPRPAADAPPAA